MRIAVLSDPNNFHTQKWCKALTDGGAEVFVFSYDENKSDLPNCVQLIAPGKTKGNYNYLSYVKGGKLLKDALLKHQIELICALNVTPFGVWATKSGFHPVISMALGADILEYPPAGEESQHLKDRGWNRMDEKQNIFQKIKEQQKRKFFRKKVAEALQASDLIIGDNEHLTQKTISWFGIPESKVRTLPWGVEPELFVCEEKRLTELRNQFNIPANKKVVLSARGAKPIYQADIILDAFEKILKSGREDVFFLMLSAGYEVSENIRLKAESLQKNFPENFLFVNRQLPREEVYHLWNLVDAFISAPVYDGYSASLAEGRYIGAIPIVNAIPANLDLITQDENGWVVDPFDTKTLVKELLYLFDNIDSLKQKFAPVNRNWIEEHSLLKKNVNIFLEWAHEMVGSAQNPK